MRKLLQGSTPLLGTWVKLPTTDSIDIVALAGFDFVVIDMEHAPLDIGTVHILLGAARGQRLPALVRVPSPDPSLISRVLDSGADGVVVPHIDSADDARRIVRASRFPPMGARGYGPTVRSGSWGADAAGYRAAAQDAVVVPQIESAAAVSDVDGIAAVVGVDMLFAGAADLAIDTGLAPSSPELSELIAIIRSAAKNHALPCATATSADPSALAQAVAQYEVVLASNDASLLAAAAASAVRSGRASLPESTHPGRASA